MKRIQERHAIEDRCPNGVVGEKIKVSLKLSEYFAEMDLYELTDNKRKDIKIALLECLNKIVKIYDKNNGRSGNRLLNDNLNPLQSPSLHIPKKPDNNKRKGVDK